MKQEIIRLWSACNQKCLFCNQEWEFDVKNKKQILLELLECKKKWVEKLVISGWEPTLFKKELFFTIETAKKIWFTHIEIQSNAVLLSDFDYVKKISKLWLDSSMISLHSFYEDVSDKLTQAKGTFKKTLQWINNLIKIWVETEINIVINLNNYKEILKYIEYIHKNILWFTSVSFSVVTPGGLTLENSLLPKYTLIAEQLTQAYDYCIKHDIDFQNPWCWIPVCFVKDYYKYSFEYENYSNWKKNDELILNRNRGNKIKSDKCKKCILNDYCLGIWKWYANLYWLEEITPITKI